MPVMVSQRTLHIALVEFTLLNPHGIYCNIQDFQVLIKNLSTVSLCVSLDHHCHGWMFAFEPRARNFRSHIRLNLN